MYAQPPTKPNARTPHITCTHVPPGGATAVVYAARDLQTGGSVALKVVACGGPKQVPISVVRREVGGAAPRPLERRRAGEASLSPR